ncbi:MAG: hypothetical protein J6Z15_06230, partial [Oscillospiraceae bacterium]|nr:hypothetical protein [Oscillospiraceae bacterium]
MKKIVRLCGLLLLATLLFSTLGGSAFAADGSVQIGSEDQLTVSVRYNNLTEEDSKAKALAEQEEESWNPPVCEITMIESDGSRVEMEAEVPAYFLPFFSPDTELFLEPPAGYYVASVTL